MLYPTAATRIYICFGYMTSLSLRERGVSVRGHAQTTPLEVMASRLSVEEVLRDLLDGDYDSDDDFGGYFDDSGDGGEGSGEQGASGGGEGDGDSDGEGGDGQGSSGSAAGIPEYRRQKGCTTDMSNKSPLDFFKLLITDAMLQQVVDQTILFAQQHIEGQELPPRSRVHQWNSAPHTISELRKFLALLIAMGIVSYPKVEDA